MQPRPVLIGCQRQRGHDGTKVRAADADVDDIRVAPALPRDFAGPHPVREAAHPVQRRMDLGQDVAAIDQDRAFGRAQRGVQDGAVLGLVDLLAREHRLAPGGDAFGKGQQQVKRGVVDGGLGPVEPQAVGRHRAAAGAIRVRVEQGRNGPVVGFGAMRGKPLPDVGHRKILHSNHSA